MCARLCQYSREIPSKVNEHITIIKDGKRLKRKWIGFATEEKVVRGLWDNWTPVTVQVTSFAERDRRTGNLVWEQGDCDIRALEFKGQVRIVTTSASREQRRKFGHGRVPATA